VLAKPMTKGTGGNIASLDARVFSTLGKPGTFNYNDQNISVVTFTSAELLKNSILEGIEKSPLLGETYAEIFQEFFKTGKITWPPETPLPVINKLGVYIGELLVGWVLLDRSMTKYFANNPFSGVVTKFHLPTDPAFSGVDSFAELSNGEYYLISSKFGSGAKASLFSNILNYGVIKYSKLSDSVFKDICGVVKRGGLSFKNSRAIVYTYGIRNILGLNELAVKDPNNVYSEIYSGKGGKDSDKVIEKIKATRGVDRQIIDSLPYSVSSFFNREIAKELMSDPKSLDQMKEILTGKDYYQANLNTTEWSKGNLKFKFISSGQAELKVIGSKSAIRDITSKQGWVNYELQYK
jgi:hypothetical protein